MNRVLGDYFETLLYKIFVSIDENTTVAEVSRLWLELFRKNAIALILAWFHTFFIALIGFYFFTILHFSLISSSPKFWKLTSNLSKIALVYCVDWDLQKRKTMKWIQSE